MDRYKSFFRGIAYAGYCIVFLFAVYTFEKSIPDQIYVKASMEFESMNAAVKGQCVKPLHQLAIL